MGGEEGKRRKDGVGVRVGVGGGVDEEEWMMSG